MRFFALFFFLYMTVTTCAQRIAGFQLFPDKEKVVIKFTIRPGISCGGYTVLHSLDSLSYSEAGSDPGICGTSSVSEDKSFTHENPVLNQVNYYKIRLEPNIETSPSKNLLVTSGVQGVAMAAFPNPFYLDDLVTLRFSDVTNARLGGYLCNPHGEPIKQLDLVCGASIAKMSTAGLGSGLYVIRLTDGIRMFTCKLIILR